ncbi:hypothetical protein AWB83_02338 [Caballeronia ptereochthonis]|uniref:Uncharacterized protein n=1 Tax=Caballeronia ptereochthonis TaxID=1777144 RepID=A0A158ATX6_9BURK|nr:hypothetical protein AWB83_02338 [Caballeronia ptereochthonis]
MLYSCPFGRVMLFAVSQNDHANPLDGHLMLYSTVAIYLTAHAASTTAASAARCGPKHIAPTAAIGLSMRASRAQPAPHGLAGRTSAPVRGSAETSCHQGPSACRDRTLDRYRACLSLESPGGVMVSARFEENSAQRPDARVTAEAPSVAARIRNARPVAQQMIRAGFGQPDFSRTPHHLAYVRVRPRQRKRVESLGSRVEAH